MLNKLYDMGVLGWFTLRDHIFAWTDSTAIQDVGAKPSDIENKVTVSSVARRRLAVVATRLKMSQTVSDVRLPTCPTHCGDRN